MEFRLSFLNSHRFCWREISKSKWIEIKIGVSIIIIELRLRRDDNFGSFRNILEWSLKNILGVTLEILPLCEFIENLMVNLIALETNILW